MAAAQVFTDRRQAGAELGRVLAGRHFIDPIVFGLPRNGVPVAFEVARLLRAPLDALAVRRLHAPFQPDVAIGAIAGGGVQILNDASWNEIHALSEADLARVVRRETAELGRRQFACRGSAPFPNLSGRDVILIDDGMATGASLCAAIAAVGRKGGRRVTVAVPVGSFQAMRRVGEIADDVVCLNASTPFRSVGNHYRSFEQISDETVRNLIGAAALVRPSSVRNG